MPETNTIAFVCRDPPSPPAAPPPPKPLTSGPFVLVPTPSTWVDAEAYCASLPPGNSHLASIRSSDENLLAWNLCHPHDCWIGFSDHEQEGNWQWSDGWPADFTRFPGGVAPWGPGQPDNQALFGGDSDGAYIWTTSNAYVTAGTWDDNPLEQHLAFLCRTDESSDGAGGGGGSAPNGGLIVLCVLLGLGLGGGVCFAYHKYAPVAARPRNDEWTSSRRWWVGNALAKVSEPMAASTTADASGYSSYAAPVVLTAPVEAPISSGLHAGL